MDVVDNVFASASDSVEQPARPVARSRRGQVARSRRIGTDLVKAASAAQWEEELRQAGFTRAEAVRLIFERTCPRDEGLQRT